MTDARIQLIRTEIKWIECRDCEIKKPLEYYRPKEHTRCGDCWRERERKQRKARRERNKQEREEVKELKEDNRVLAKCNNTLATNQKLSEKINRLADLIATLAVQIKLRDGDDEPEKLEKQMRKSLRKIRREG